MSQVFWTFFTYLLSASADAVLSVHLKLATIIQILRIFVMIGVVLMHDVIDHCFRHFNPKVMFACKRSESNAPYVGPYLKEAFLAGILKFVVQLP